jgi:hypothetical protein
MGDGNPISCRECNHYSNGRCNAYNTVVKNADIVYMMCQASDRVQSLPEVAPPSFVVGLGEKIVAAEAQSSPKVIKQKRKRKKKPASVG